MYDHRRRKSCKYFVLLLALALMVTSLGTSVFALEEGVGPMSIIEVGDADALEAALDAATTGDTIKLTSTIDYNKGITIENKDITFDLGSYNLIVDSSTGNGLEVTDCTVSLIGTGEFNVTGGHNGVYVVNGTVTVSNATGKGEYGAYADGASSITITGDAVATPSVGGYGAYARNGAEISIGGNAIGGGKFSYGANTLDGIIHVTGNAEGEYCGAYASGAKGIVTVGGNAIATGDDTSIGAQAFNGGTVKVTGDAQGGGTGAYAFGTLSNDAQFSTVIVGGNAIATLDGGCGASAVRHGEIKVAGNVTARGEGSCGADANGGGSVDCNITVDGTITAPNYVSVGGTVKAKGDVTLPTTKEDYHTYNSKFDTVWVKEVAPDNVEEVGDAETLDDILTRIMEDDTYGDGLTIRLLNDITLTGSDNGIYLDYKTLTIDLNGKNLDILPDGRNPEVAVTVYGGELKLTGEGELNVTGYNTGVASFAGGKATVTNATGITSVGAYIYDENGEITVLNDAQGAHCGVVVAEENSKVTVEGNASATGSEVYGSNSGVEARSGHVEVKGDVIGVDYGVQAAYGGTVVVEGDVTANGEPTRRYGGGWRAIGIDSIVGWDAVYGVSATGGSEVTVDGKITAPDYIIVGEEERSGSTASRTLPSTKEGYYTFSDSKNTVWVKERPKPNATLTDIADQILESLEEGYAAGTQEVKRITISKSGADELENISVTMSQLDQDYFNISYPDNYRLTNDMPKATFTVSAKDHLEQGTHTATVTVAAVNVEPVTFKVTQEVRESGAPPVTKYTLNVVNGTGSGSYPADTPVNITADPAPDGKVFDRWISDNGGTFADDTSRSTIFTMPAGAVTVTATYKNVVVPPTYHTITASAGKGGSISPSGNVKVKKDGSQTFTIKADSNYRISSVVVDGVDQGAVESYTFTNVTANHNIVAAFSHMGYTLNVVNGTGSGNYLADTPVNITADPAPDGKVFDRWISDNGGTFADDTSRSTIFTMPARAVTVTATYKDVIVPPTYYTITASAGKGGSISPSGDVTVKEGDSQTFNINPDSNYRISSVVVDGVDQGAVDTYTFTNVTANHTIRASFSYMGNDSNGGGGSGGSSGGGKVKDQITPITIIPFDTTKPHSFTTAKAQLSASVNTNGHASVTVPSKVATDAIQAAQDAAKRAGVEKNGIAVAIDIATSKAPSTFNVKLPKTTQDKLIAAGVKEFRLQCHGIIISFDHLALQQIKATANADVTVVASKIDVKKLPIAAQNTIGQRAVYELKAIYADKVITHLGKGTMWITIPYSVTTNEKPDNIRGLYVDENGKVTVLASSNYDVKAKTITFSTNSFAIIGVGYKADIPVFSDIKDHWAKHDIDFVAERGLLAGTGNNQFSPDIPMTRGMFVTALGRLAGIEPDSYKTTGFNDVNVEAYYGPFVGWAEQKGIVNGTSTITFSPDTAITREEMAVIIHNYSKLMGYTLPKNYQLVTFSDNADISSWAEDAVKVNQQAGIILGKGENRFDPKAMSTRAEVAAVLHRYVELVITIQTE